MSDLTRDLLRSGGIYCPEVDVRRPRMDFQSAIQLDRHNGSAGLGLVVVSLLDT